MKRRTSRNPTPQRFAVTLQCGYATPQLSFARSHLRFDALHRRFAASHFRFETEQSGYAASQWIVAPEWRRRFSKRVAHGARAFTCMTSGMQTVPTLLP
jgi:hypothetical protein